MLHLAMHPIPPITPLPGLTEPFSSLTHLLGAVLFLMLGVWLVRRTRGDRWRAFACGLYVATVVFLLCMSGIYHMLPDGPWRELLRRLDHAAIFSLIVGTMTPVHQILFRGFMRWGWIALIWIMAVAAITLKVLMFSGLPEWIGLTLYLFMGWLGLITAALLWSRRGQGYIRLMAAGGIAYTVGAISEFIHWPVLWPGIIGSHELFHVAVLIGLGFHWWLIHRIAALPLDHHPADA